MLDKLKGVPTLIQSLERVAKDAEGENGGWKIKLIIFVAGTCGR